MKFLVLAWFILLGNNGKSAVSNIKKEGKALLNLSLEMYKYKSKQ